METVSPKKNFDPAQSIFKPEPTFRSGDQRIFGNYKF